MKWRLITILSILFWLRSGEFDASAQSHQLPRQLRFSTQWAKDVSGTNAHPEYPRPTMVRTNWLNLNGIWDFGFSSCDQTNSGIFNNNILVPFPAESLLSGVKHTVTEQQRMWYRRQFEIPSNWHRKRVLLHFEAVDWETEVWVNGLKMGTHKGGYDRFTFDITDAIKAKGPQELIVSVFDPTDSEFQSRGLQMLRPRPPFFSACSGIWQTVWLEPVPETSIQSLKLVPDIDTEVLRVTIQGAGATNNTTVEAVAMAEGKSIDSATGHLESEFDLQIPHPKLWSPSKPFLYDLKVTLLKNGKTTDTVTSYFGMRKISIAKNESGFHQIMLNNHKLFELGTLDQGYWPDGIYTAPTDAAIKYDIETMKTLGFNMCRKHLKIEPERWYYWCDKLGLLVWQDMPNSDRATTSKEKEIHRQPKSSRLYETDLKRMIIGRGNHPCIIMWIPFNQGWGQYDTLRITEMIKKLDPTRLVDSASGWNDMGSGDVRSYHEYFGPVNLEIDNKRANVLGECGALGLVDREHQWGRITTWNITYYRTLKELTDAYRLLITNLKSLKDNAGLAAAVITQWSDVESELDGFITYDRAVIKMPTATVRELNEQLISSQNTGSSTNK